jgi:3-hydroxymyristoyl/3-hydroxydecanoyl-(acyl carrier protein) dehydratase
MRSEHDEIKRWFTLPVKTESNIDFYSAASYTRSTLGSTDIANNIADALCQPLDFPHLLRQIYDDGARIFIELGPGGTCTRWISETLKQEEHGAIAFNTRGVDDHTSVIRTLAKLVSHRVELDLSPLYRQAETSVAKPKELINTISLGGKPIYPEILSAENKAKFSPKIIPPFTTGQARTKVQNRELVTTASSRPQSTTSYSFIPEPMDTPKALSTEIPNRVNHQTPTPNLDIGNSRAPFKIKPHSAFLQMRQDSLQHIGQLIELQIVLAQQMSTTDLPQSRATISPPTPLLDEKALLQFATDTIAPVFGQNYAIIDTYPNRIRLPMPPYLFVSRVTQLEAEKGVFKPCFIETEYDIPTDAWYTIEDQVPAAIFVEASQGNIVLISYLGIDFEIKGARSFRALDGTLQFLRPTPRAGETFRCEVHIHSFTRGGGTLLYFYTCDYFVGDRKFLELKAGAGFFTEKELQKAPGVTLTKQELANRSKIQKQEFTPLLSCPKVTFNEQDLLHLSNGNLTDCFGSDYGSSQNQNPSLRLPLSDFRMMDRVLAVNPKGGDWGLGILVAEKDLHPEQWYFNCHFKDDYCMPGTVVGEGAAQLLQFYLLYLGLHTSTTKAQFHPIPNLIQSSRSRGQVTPGNGKLIYQLEVFEVGLNPTPFLKAEATVKFKGKTISMIKNLGIQLLEPENL